MRSKLIITAAIGVLAAATLTVNAENAARRTTPTRPAVAVALAAHTRGEDGVAVAVRSTTADADDAARPEVKQSSRPDVDIKPVLTPATRPGCAAAIANLKAMHQADVMEDASERTTARPENALTAATNDRSEDASEALNWAGALKAAHTACAPAPSVRTTCLSAISGLQTVLTNLREQELTETQGIEADGATDVASVRTAFSAIQMACAERE